MSESSTAEQSPASDSANRGDTANAAASASAEKKTSPSHTPPMLIRIALGTVGLGLFAGFFLPWVHVGDMVSFSGLTLMISGGQATDAMSGLNRALILVVPLSGILLFMGAVKGFRLLALGSLISGFSIFLVGIYTLIRVFLDSTGSGMWVVTASALSAITIGLVYSRLRLRRLD